MVEPPQKIGPYKIVRKIGEGGMGVVFEGVHELIGRRVAIKVLHPEFAQRSEVVARFFNEARAVNRVAHPGLVQISDYGQLPDKGAYIVMEFLSGAALSGRINNLASPLSLGQVLNFGYQLADALAAAHARDVIHRDLKPDNVMIVSDGQAPGGERSKLLDFGIAKLVDDSGQIMVRTRTDAIMGTPYYMSPEQCRGAGQVDGRTDVYSLGVMLYEMFSGERPIGGAGHAEIIARHLTVEPAPLVSKAPRVPKAVAALVHRMLIKNRDQRPTMQEVAVELEALSAETPPPAKRRTTANVPVVSVAVTTVPGHPSAANKRGRNFKASVVPEAAVETLPPPATVAPAAEVPMPAAAIESPPPPSTVVAAAGQAMLTSQRRRNLGLAGGLFVAVCLLGLFLFRAPHGPSAGARLPTVRVRIDSTPPGAEVVQVTDGQVLGKTPWTVQRPAQKGLLKLRLRLVDYGEKELELDQSTDSSHAEILLALLKPPKLPSAVGEQQNARSTRSSHKGTRSEKSDVRGGKKHRHRAAPKATSHGGASQLVD